MKQLIFSLVVCVFLLAGNSVKSQIPFAVHQYFDLAGESGYGMFKASPLGGYVGVAYNNIGNQRQLKVVRFNQNGETLWSKNMHTYPYYDSYNMWLVGADISEDGSLYILTAVSVWWNVAYNEVFRVSATGDSIWSIIAPEKGEYTKPIYNDIKCMPNGGCVIVGQTNWQTRHRVCKVSKSGEVLWTNSDFQNYDGFLRAVSVNKKGEIFVTGRIYNSASSRDRFLVAKIDSLGTTKWLKTYYSGFTDSQDSLTGSGYSIVDTDDGCIVGGFETDKGSGSGQAVFKKLDSEGNLLWQRKYFGFKGSNPAIAYNIVKINEKDKFVAYGHQIAGSTDARPFLIKFTTTGDSIWSQLGIDRRSNLSGVDNNDNLLFCGYLPMEATGWAPQSYLVRTTSDGIYQTPQLWGEPYDNDAKVNLRPKLTWLTTAHIGTYKLQIAKDSLFSSIGYEATDIQPTAQMTNHTLTTSLKPMTKYFSRVQIIGPQGNSSSWSSIRRFTTSDNTSFGNKKENIFSVYPNPANTTINIQFEGLQNEESKIEIIDFSGKLVYQAKIVNAHTGPMTIDISKFGNGIYNCRLSNDEYWSNRKFVINK